MFGLADEEAERPTVRLPDAWVSGSDPRAVDSLLRPIGRSRPDTRSDPAAPLFRALSSPRNASASKMKPSKVKSEPREYGDSRGGSGERGGPGVRFSVDVIGWRVRAVGQSRRPCRVAQEGTRAMSRKQEPVLFFLRWVARFDSARGTAPALLARVVTVSLSEKLVNR